jgi:divalent metal cation (Fe/Co/Zn/Cd) transporter
MAERAGLIQLAPIVTPTRQLDRDRLAKRARLLAWAGNTWHVVEFGVALAAGIAAGSVALVGFGADSLIEAVAGLIVVWRFTGSRHDSAHAEGRAQQAIAFSYALLVLYIVVAASHSLIATEHPQESWVGIGLAAFTAVTMPLLARAKRQVGRQLHSSATVSEAGQNQLCAYLSVALLIGLVANAVVGWWWTDPIAALAIAALAAREGWTSWKGESCECC